jgi:hypothetical protein
VQPLPVATLSFRSEYYTIPEVSSYEVTGLIADRSRRIYLPVKYMPIGATFLRRITAIDGYHQQQKDDDWRFARNVKSELHSLSL